ncbi:conserved hypothetical protein [Neospora caninum Liverpool]|uniref:Uncharacterized protein n=1 Tax=Neospora caninum (strain Liverpool) TaxID=572307 RepID=F0VHG3_NEOCL|nr:conserved hypothetical protein [Neospora caninum Liverpool]CBZ53157.1 conserved hypothetical protein [Neospora caninum Liverpool]CEL67147.1 TPA: hypothetical protein BN1204_029440 [Neospora caninum Liverpool]|eukprot:XP_003883189.1 conserved hypothetical protein [Neospora caninum Liverpool]
MAGGGLEARCLLNKSLVASRLRSPSVRSPLRLESSLRPSLSSLHASISSFSSRSFLSSLSSPSLPPSPSLSPSCCYRVTSVTALSSSPCRSSPSASSASLSLSDVPDSSSASLSFSPRPPACLSVAETARDRLWPLASFSRFVSFKNRAEWRAFMRLPPKSRVEPRRPIPRIFPWRMAHNPLPRRYPLYKHRALFLPLSLPSYAPQPAISGVPTAPLTITTNAAHLPRTCILQNAVRQMQPLSSSSPSSPSSSSPPSSSSSSSSFFPLELPGVLRHTVLRSRGRAAHAPSWVSALATCLHDDAARLSGLCFPSAPSGSPNIDRPPRCAFSGAFVVVYSADEFPAVCAVRTALAALAPEVRLEGRQEAGVRLLKILRREDGLEVFVKNELNRPDKTRKTALARRETGKAAVQSILLTCGVSSV